jgi:hypothetical protein
VDLDIMAITAPSRPTTRRVSGRESAVDASGAGASDVCAAAVAVALALAKAPMAR